MVRTEDGCRLWTSEAGAGDPLILCHGGPGLWDMFGDLVPMLADRMHVIRWDHRGCGRSARRGPYSLTRTVEDLDAVRSAYGFDRVALLGHSWGARVVLRYAIDHPDRTSRLGYVSGNGIDWDWNPEYHRNLAERLGEDLARISQPRGAERTEAEAEATRRAPVDGGLRRPGPGSRVRGTDGHTVVRHQLRVQPDHQCAGSAGLARRGTGARLPEPCSAHGDPGRCAGHSAALGR
jgi:pimeloyl-ACP methyl ester carboxylesterase